MSLGFYTNATDAQRDMISPRIPHHPDPSELTNTSAYDLINRYFWLIRASNEYYPGWDNVPGCLDDHGNPSPWLLIHEPIAFSSGSEKNKARRDLDLRDFKCFSHFFAEKMEWQTVRIGLFVEKTMRAKKEVDELNGAVHIGDLLEIQQDFVTYCTAKEKVVTEVWLHLSGFQDDAGSSTLAATSSWVRMVVSEGCKSWPWSSEKLTGFFNAVQVNLVAREREDEMIKDKKDDIKIEPS